MTGNDVLSTIVIVSATQNGGGRGEGVGAWNVSVFDMKFMIGREVHVLTQKPSFAFRVRDLNLNIVLRPGTSSST